MTSFFLPNHTVEQYTKTVGIKRIIAQKDIPSSNSKIEAVNKVIKHQFLFPLNLTTENEVIEAIPKCIDLYNDHRPQRSLNGYTPNEAYEGTPLDYSALTTGFKEQKELRIEENKKNSCKICLSI